MFTNEFWFPKYFAYTYGINGPERLTYLIDSEFAYEESAFDSLNHIKSEGKKIIIRKLEIKGVSKMLVRGLDRVFADQVTEEDLGAYFDIRGIAITEISCVVGANQVVVDRHPRKKF